MAKQIQRGLTTPTYDTRIIERNLRMGLIDKKEYDAHLKQLEDDENNAEFIEIADETTADADAGTEVHDDPERLTFT